MRRPALVLLALFAAILFARSVRAATPNDVAVEAQEVAHLLDYVGSDYGGAVVGGQLVDARELAEQLAIVDDATKILGTLAARSGDAGDQALVERVRAVRRLLDAHAPEKEVARAATEAREAIAARFELKESPDHPPSRERGQELYAQLCTSCHGGDGRADTPAAEKLEPRPANFLDARVAGSLSPYRVFTTVRYGVPNTAMAPFAGLSDDDRWSLAFWVASLDHATPAQPERDARFVTLAELSMRSDDELRADLRAAGIPDAAVERSLADLRTRAPFERAGEGSTLSIARASLLRVTPLYRKGDHDGARRRLLEAYLDGVEPSEAPIRAKDAVLARSIEGTFQSLRGAIEQRAGDERVEQLAQAMLADIGKAERVLGDDAGPKSFWSMALTSAGIALREGVEAALLIAALLAVVTRSGHAERRRYVHVGWALALVAGLLTWLASTRIVAMSGAHREMMEGVTALLAAAVLFYVSYWLLAKREVARWMTFLREKASGRRAALSLLGVAFLAVYREAFETVLFYQALVSQPGSGPAAVAGIAIGLGALVILVLVYGRAGKFAPPHAFFTFSSLLLYALAVVFSGQGIAALQTTGTLPLHTIALPRLPALGVYPTVETYAVQLALVAAAVIAAVTMRGKGKPAA